RGRHDEERAQAGMILPPAQELDGRDPRGKRFRGRVDVGRDGLEARDPLVVAPLLRPRLGALEDADPFLELDLFDRLDDVPAVRVSADGIDLAAEATVVVRVLLVLEIRQDDLEAVARAPDRVGPGCVRTDEDEGRRADPVLVRAVAPDLERMDAESAVDLTAGRGLAMELIDPAAVVELARELLLDLLEP